MQTKFAYVGIRVKNMANSLDFYTKFLGMKDKGHSRLEVTKGDITYLRRAAGHMSKIPTESG